MHSSTKCLYYWGLYNVANVTPPRMSKEPINIYHDKTPEKYRGKNNDRKSENTTPQKAYVTFRHRALAAPILSIAVYQQRNEYIPIAAVIASNIQHGA